jgi:thiol-disulfide isomerase/thioredoxin
MPLFVATNGAPPPLPGDLPLFFAGVLMPRFPRSVLAAVQHAALVVSVIALLERACHATSDSDLDAANRILQEAGLHLCGPQAVEQRLRLYSTISSNNLAAVASRTFNLTWRWPDSLDYTLQEHSGPGSQPRLSQIHVAPGVIHVVNAGGSAYYSEKYDGLTAANAHHLGWLEVGIYDALFFGRLLAGDLAVDLRKRLVDHETRESSREDVILHSMRIAVPYGEYSIRAPRPDLHLFVSVWLEENSRDRTIVPIALQLSFPPDLSEGPQGQYWVGSVQRTLVWNNIVVRADDDDFQFEAPPGANRVASVQELLGLPEDVEIEGEPQDLLDKPAPAFELPALNDEEVSLPMPDPNAPIVILDFWATWCAPCVRALPLLIDLVSEFDDDDVVLYAINVGEPQDKVQEFVELRKWKLHVLFDENREVMALYKAVAIPQTVILDRRGIVRHVHIGFDAELKEKLGTVLTTLLSEDGVQSDDVPR